jgi:hypothetical protein
MKAKLRRLRTKMLLTSIFNNVIGKDEQLENIEIMKKKEMEMEEKVLQAYMKKMQGENENYPLKLLEMFSFNSIRLIYKLHPHKTFSDKMKRLLFYTSKFIKT